MFPTQTFSGLSIAFNAAANASTFNAPITPINNWIDSIKDFRELTPRTSADTLVAGDYIVPVAAASSFNLTLPDAATTTHGIYIPRIDANYANEVNIVCAGSDVIQNLDSQTYPSVSSQVSLRPFESLALYPIGTQWCVLSRSFAPRVNALAYASTDTPVLTIGTKITLDSEQFDNANSFSTSTSVYTSPIRGYYTLGGVVRRSGGTNGVFIAFRFAITDVSAGVTQYHRMFNTAINTGADEYYPLGSTQVFLDKGDTVYLDGFTASGSPSTKGGSPAGEPYSTFMTISFDHP